MNALESRSHSIQTKQRAKSREGDKHGAAASKTSPGARESSHSKEKDAEGPVRSDAREPRLSETVGMAEAEEAVKKIYLITGECVHVVVCLCQWCSAPVRPPTR